MNCRGFSKVGCILVLVALGSLIYMGVNAGPLYFGVMSFKDEVEAEVQRLRSVGAPDKEVVKKVREAAVKKMQNGDNPDPVPESAIIFTKDLVTIEWTITYNLGFFKTKATYRVECKILRF